MPGTYQVSETSDPSAPAAGNRILYAKTDGWYDRDDATISRIGAVNNYATAAPGVGDDTADGYSVGSVWIDVTNDQFYICVDSTAGAAVWHNVTGTLRASDGSPVALTVGATGAVTAAIAPFTLTGGQLKFPATQNASADANTLDDYEEGAWTPAITFGGAAVGVTYSASNAGTYTKIGNLVSITGYLLLTAKGSSVGAALVQGLPFTVINVVGGHASTSVWLTAVIFANQMVAYTAQNTTTIVLGEVTEAGVNTDLTNADFGETAGIILNATYRIAN